MAELNGITIKHDAIVINYTIDKWRIIAKRISLRNSTTIKSTILKQVVTFIFHNFKYIFGNKDVVESTLITMLFRPQSIVVEINNETVINIYETDVLIVNNKLNYEIKNWKAGYIPESIKIFD